MVHVRRYFAALGVLLTLFGTYALAVAPWIAPPPIKAPDAKASSTPIAASPTIDADLERLFPADAWERNGAKIIETDRCTLIIRDYEPTPDGKLLLKPCTLIMHAGSQAAKRPIVMQAPQGAELVFDRALDLARAQFGRLQKGKLNGEIRIFSPPSIVSGRDALELKTREVQLADNRVSTTHDVEFRYGDSFGRGSDLAINLLPKPDGDTGKSKASWSGVQSLTLRQLYQLRIASAGGGLLGKSAEPKAPKAADASGEWIEVSCSGPFTFDMLGQIARFEDRVEVRRLAPNVPPDRLRCQTLYLGFGAQDKSVRAANAATDDPLAGRLQKITAVGSPATLEAPASGIEASAAIMEYSLADRRITLQPDEAGKKLRKVTRVSLRQFGQHFTASELHYEMGEGKRLGKLWAAGPGELRLLQGKGVAQQTVVARWEKELRIQPQERNQVISLVGAASVTVDPLGRFDADELHLWVLEAPAEGAGDPQRVTIVPDRLKAIGGVKLSSLQLDADTSQLEAWFINLPPDQEERVAPPMGPGEPVREPVREAVTPARYMAGPQSGPGAGLLPASENGVQEGGLLPAHGNSTQQAAIRDVIRAPNLQKFYAGGGLIQMRLIVRGRKFDLEDLTIRGHAVIDETRTPEPGQEPIRIAGERIEVRGGTTAEATCQVHGQPAEVGGRGLSLAGGVVQIHRGQNRMWIDGPGEATLPAPSDQVLLPGGGGSGGAADRQPLSRPTGPPQKMHLVWNRQFHFDGLTARFEGEIVGRTSTQTAHGHALEARLAQRLDFAATDKQSSPEVARVDLVGGPSGVYLDSRGLDGRGEQVSREQMQVRHLTIDRSAGKMHGEGPGWVSTVRRAGTLPVGMPMEAGNPRVAAGGEAPLTSIHVSFDRAIEGDMARRQIWFRDRVRTTYSPANDFSDLIEAKKPSDLGERGLLMTSDKLTLTEMLVSGRRWFEAQATDRVIAEGNSLTVEAASIRYTSDKEVLTIEGSARTPIHGWHTAVVGQRPTTFGGQKVSYHLRSGQLEADSVDRIEFNLNGGLKLPGR